MSLETDKNQAVKAMRIYLGSVDYAPVRAQQRLFVAVVKAINHLSVSSNILTIDLWEMVEGWARNEGVIRPRPGKDFCFRALAANFGGRRLFHGEQVFRASFRDQRGGMFFSTSASFAQKHGRFLYAGVLARDIKLMSVDQYERQGLQVLDRSWIAQTISNGFDGAVADSRSPQVFYIWNLEKVKFSLVGERPA